MECQWSVVLLNMWPPVLLHRLCSNFTSHYLSSLLSLSLSPPLSFSLSLSLPIISDRFHFSDTDRTRSVSGRMLLEYEKQIFADLMDNDGLLIMAK